MLNRSTRSTNARVMAPALLVALAGSAGALAQNWFPPALGARCLDGATGFVIGGFFLDDRSGYSVSSAGDVNDDGIGDLIIGAFGASPNGHTDAGESYVVFGTATGFAASLDLATLDGTNGFVIKGIDANDFSGGSVSSAGDVNGDGIGDVIIGARTADPNGQDRAGECYIVFGRATGFAASLNLSTLNGTNGFVINGIDASDYSGYSVSCAGDVNGDGIDDVIIGAPRADPSGQSQAGESYVVFGKDTGFAASLNLSTLDGTNGFVLIGVDASDRSGWSVSSAGDVNGDGIGDLIIGAHAADPHGQDRAGESYVVFGTATGFAASFNLSILNGTNGFVVNGINPGDQSGWAVSTAGDINGDGIGDIIIGANHADPGGRTSAGASYIVFGTAAGFAASLNLSALDGTNGFVVNGIGGSDQSGTSVSSAGDVNGDGIDDFIIGAPGAGPIGQDRAGESCVVFGTATGFAASFDLSTLDGTNGFLLSGIAKDDSCGRSVSSAGDVNGDGIGDLIVGALNARSSSGQNSGESYVVFGHASGPCPSDLNGDGVTNAGDFIILAGSFGLDAGAIPSQGDLNGDCAINAADFTILANNFGCGN